MANPAHSDIIEEDAADLQFPKGMFIIKLLINKIYIVSRH